MKKNNNEGKGCAMTIFGTLSLTISIVMGIILQSFWGGLIFFVFMMGMVSMAADKNIKM